jgi:hypothetical protein
VRIVRVLLFAVVFLAASGWGVLSPAAAQDSQFLMPAPSAAKAKQIIQQAIAALGGPAYLNVHDSTCTGRLGQFGHSGDLEGFETFIDYTEPPGKDRTENLPKRNLIQVYNGDKGWVLDRGGVSEAAPSDLIQYQQDVLKDLDNILRHRIHEKDMIFRYAGPDIVDLHEADWVELVDSDNRTIRIAFSKETHLPLRKVVETRDPMSRSTTQETEYFSNFHPVGGIETPFQITRQRNGMKVFQVFFDKCDYNTGLSDSLFTKESLDERWAKIGKKEMEKEAKAEKKKKKDKNQDADSDSDPDSDSH